MKDTKEDAVASAPAPKMAPEPITLDEFCMRLSQTDRRVELIGGFAHSERAAGHIKDLESEFQRRYVAFANQPA